MTLPNLINALTLLLTALIFLCVVQIWRTAQRRNTDHKDASDSASKPFAPSAPVLRLEEPTQSLDRWSMLTLQQRKVARLAAEGKQNGEIAQILHIRSSTVNTHLKNIYRALEIHSRRELTAYLQDIER